MLRILSVVGTRPNFVKIGALHRAFAAHPCITSRIVHTGQHYDAKMSDVFFRQLELPEPHRYLGVGSGSHAEQTASIMVAFEKAVLEEAPDLVVVVGDVNSTMAAALVTTKLNVPLAHVEAGLRSFDRHMPEEANRVVTDHLADYLYVTEASGLENLQREGIPETRICFAGNVMIDSLLRFKEKATTLRTAEQFGLTAGGYALVTMHRPSNVDAPENLARVAALMEHVSTMAPVLFPLHPRTRQRLADEGHLDRLSTCGKLHLVDPLGYLEFLSLMIDAGIVITDSGGIQEETTALGVPCVTLRENTERPVTIELGTNELLPLNPAAVEEAARKALSGAWKKGSIPPGWDGQAATRVAHHLAAQF